MIIDIKQLYKELFEAKFVIECDNTAIGEFFVQGNITTMEGRLRINFAGMSIEMKHGKKNLPKGDKTFRPYDITINDQPAGTVYQTNIKEGGLFSKYPVFRLYLNGESYTEYTVCFKGEGAKSPIYHGDTQVAESHKSNVIINDMHNYRGYMKDKAYALIFVLFSCYSYVVGFFKPGEKMIKGKRINYYVTTNKYELAKYDSDFIKDC